MCNSLAIYSNCIRFNDNRVNIAIKDSGNKQTFKAKNPNRYPLICLRIDGCVIKDGKKQIFYCMYKKI